MTTRNSAVGLSIRWTCRRARKFARVLRLFSQTLRLEGNAVALRACLAVTCILASLWSGAAVGQPTSDQPAAISKAVSHCVIAVHNTHPTESWMQQYYTNFDAFYNPASGAVQNNAQTVGDMKALFVFNKCMAEQGYPLR
jgi:hypothetical protein